MSSSDDPAERAIGGMVVTLRLRLFGLTFSSAEIANQLASSCSAASSDLERQRTLAILKFANKNPSTLRRLFLSAVWIFTPPCMCLPRTCGRVGLNRCRCVCCRLYCVVLCVCVCVYL